MKPICTLVLVFLISTIFLKAQPGSSCASPYTLTLDGVTRTYATSASTGSALVCTMSGSSPITYFQFTTNAAAEMPLLNITAPGGTNCEVAMYNGTSCTGGALEAASTICMFDATGLWSPAHNFVLSPNTTYKLRIKTSAAGNISINAKNYTPTNNTCAGATNIGPVPIWDNNACHLPDNTVNASYLCAFSLENTAWYAYTLASTGSSTINITGIACDNGDVNNSNGFQIGFFTSNCPTLVPLTCASNSGSTVTASTPSLPAGTRVTVAIDGVAGSNCQYNISASNSVGLAAYIKYFTAEKSSRSNIIRWASFQEFNNDYYEVERSTDGKNFVSVGRVEGEMESFDEKKYTVQDDQPAQGKSFYRLKQVDIDGNIKYHRVVSVNRSDMPYVDLSFENPVSSNLIMNVQTNQLGRLNLRVISMQGYVLYNETIRCTKGENFYSKNFSSLPQGKYIIEASNDRMRVTKTMIKTYNSPAGIK